MTDFDVCAEREGVFVDLQRREFGAQHLEQLDVQDELFITRHEAAFEPTR